jgi:hypothetical protein
MKENFFLRVMKRNLSNRTSWQKIESMRTANEDEKETDETILSSEPPLQRINVHCKQKYEWKVVISRRHMKVNKSKAIPVTGRGGPKGCEKSRLPHFLDSRLTKGGEVFSLTRGRPLLPGRFLVIISVIGCFVPRAIVRLDGLGQLKNPLASSGIEPATFRLVAYCINQYATA